MHPESFFRFSRGERNGIMVLLFLLIPLVFINFLHPGTSSAVSEDSLFFSQLNLLAKETDSVAPQNGASGLKALSASPPERFRSSQKKPLPIELNTATPEQLEALPGIGEKLSVRIIRYRDLLGGFYSTEQLCEVYGLSLSVYRLIESSVSADTSEIRVLRLDTVSFRTLLRHPYLTYQGVKQIMNVRDRLQLKTWTSLKGLIPDSVFFRLKPYCR